MQLLGPSTFPCNSFVPFTATLTNWATAGSDYLITYDSATNHFLIPNASSNDYLVIWYVELKTATTSNYPILGLEFLYGEQSRYDYFIAPCKTVQFCNSALYHIRTLSTPDILSVGLKAVGEDTETFTLSSLSNCNITAKINILGL